ncbi:MAG: hypothetical protein ACI8TX_002500 [Hyphomicrobiaceae bacterium]|jgi:hypothetical protein
MSSRAISLGCCEADVAPLVSKHSPGSTTEGLWTEFHGDQTKRITGLPTHSRAWAELLCDERYQAMGDRYLGAKDYWLNTGQLICIGPGESEQMLHRDELNWPAAMRDDEITVTAIFALTDFTEANGATVIARTLPERVQYLLGFRSYSPEVGGRLGLVDYDDAARLLD